VSERGYYPELVFPAWFKGPDAMRKLVTELWAHRYEALYEKGGDLDLDEAIARGLASLGDPAKDDRAWRRCGFLARTLALAARDTVLAHAPNDERPARVISALEGWLDHKKPPPAADAKEFPERPIVTPQALGEALGVLRGALSVGDRSNANKALEEMSDDCLQGYAIVPGSSGRRDLFNWWLIAALPAAWSERLPDKIYSIRWKWPPPGE
jgi:hypothetical protein